MKSVNPQEPLGNAYLRERGVLEPTFLSHGGEIDSSPHCMTISERLKRDFTRVRLSKDWEEVQEILWFSVPNSHGEHSHWLARPLPIFKKLKFVAPVGSDSLPWIPPETRNVAKDVGVPLVFVEGPIRAMVLLQAQAHPISIQGVWGIAAAKEKETPKPVDLDDIESDYEFPPPPAQDDDRAKVKLRPEIADFKLWKRPVYLCLDADSSTNKNVRQGEIRSWFLLHAAGAEVFRLSWLLSEGKGIDDFLAAKAGTDPKKQAEAFAGLVEQARLFIGALELTDLPIIRKELHRAISDPVVFDELAGRIAKQLKVSKASLGKFKYGKEEKSQPNLGGARPVKIAPTAEPWGEKVVASEVLDEICTSQARFLWMKPSQRRAVALLITLTYLHDAVDILPILLVTSPEEECGKSTLLKFVLFLSNRPLPASNISASAIFRTIEAHCPTLILDEADSYLQENEEMRGVINSGHEREFAYVIRNVSLPNGELIPSEFSTWCPKAIAMIGLPKRTILSRSVHIRLGRKPKNVKTEKLKKKHYQEFDDLRRKISRLANQIRGHVKVYEDQSLDNRAGDNWEPLFAIANAAGGEWLKETKLAAQRMCRKDAQEMKSFGRYLLESLDRIIKAEREKLKLPPDEKIFLKTLDLVKQLNRDDEAPWKDSKFGMLTARGLSKGLGGFEIKSKKEGSGQDRGMGYWSDDIEREIQKYAHT